MDKVWNDLLENRGGERSTNENITRDGRTILCEWYNTPLIDPDGTVIGVASLADDITERKQAEKQLRQSEERFRSIIDASPIPFALNDDQQNIVYLNPEFIRTFGYNLEDIPTLSDWWPKAYPDAGYRQWVAEAWQKRLDQAKEHGTPFEPIELNIQCKDGESLTALCSAANLGESYESDIHLVILYDITSANRPNRSWSCIEITWKRWSPNVLPRSRMPTRSWNPSPIRYLMICAHHCALLTVSAMHCWKTALTSWTIPAGITCSVSVAVHSAWAGLSTICCRSPG